jgi:uncharacterized protein
LNQELSSIYNSGGPQISVLTIPSLEDQTIEERAIQVFDQWKIGKKGKDNGVLILIAKKERKVRIEVGYGLEGDIPDAYAKRIVEDVMLPQFRTGQFTTGVVLGIQQIAHLSHVELQQNSKLLRGKPRTDIRPEMFIFLLLWVLLEFLRARSNRHVRAGRGPYTGGWGGGGGFGGGGGWSGGGGGSGGGGASGGW